MTQRGTPTQTVGWNPEESNEMRQRHLPLALLILSLPSIAANLADSPEQMSIMDLMQSVITPVTNTMWSIEDPASDSDWKPFEAAARDLVTAARQVREGGTGPMDNEWAADPRWTAWTDIMLAAAEDAVTAAQAQNLDAYIEATNVMYPPCEECHLQFNPALQQ